jgi:hypothetical protein
VGRKAIASLSAEKYGRPYFSARKRTSKYSRSRSFVARLLTALSGLEHLTLLVGKESVALALFRMI